LIVSDESGYFAYPIKADGADTAIGGDRRSRRPGVRQKAKPSFQTGVAERGPLLGQRYTSIHVVVARAVTSGLEDLEALARRVDRYGKGG
jgi:hypothetical protein